MQLDRTIIIPTDDIELARSLFQSLVHEEVVLLLVVLGKDEQAKKTAELADKLARIEIQGFKRKVVWCLNRDLLADEFRALKPGKENLAQEDLNQVIGFSLSLSDTVMDVIHRNDIIDFVRIDAAFFKAGMKN